MVSLAKWAHSFREYGFETPDPKILMSANISHSTRFAKGLFVKNFRRRRTGDRYIATLLKRVLDDRMLRRSCLLPQARLI